MPFDMNLQFGAATDDVMIFSTIPGATPRAAGRLDGALCRADVIRNEAKDVDENTELLVPAPLPPETAAALGKAAVAAFLALEGEGLGRVDFLIDRASGEFFVNEVNSLPGFTEVSMFPKLWEASGLPYSALLDRLIEAAMERQRRRVRLETQYRRL